MKIRLTIVSTLILLPASELLSPLLLRLAQADGPCDPIVWKQAIFFNCPYPSTFYSIRVDVYTSPSIPLCRRDPRLRQIATVQQFQDQTLVNENQLDNADFGYIVDSPYQTTGTFLFFYGSHHFSISGCAVSYSG